MEAFSALSDPRAAAPVLWPANWLARTLVAAALALLAGAGLLLCARRLSGALSEPLPAHLLVVVGLALTAAAVLFRRVFAGIACSRNCLYAIWAAPTAVLLLWLLALVLEGTSTIGLIALVGAALLEEGWSWGRLSRIAAGAVPARSGRRSTADSDRSAGEQAIATPSFVAPVDVGERVALSSPTEPDELDEAGGLTEYDESVTQQIVRRREPTGEVLEGWTRVDFVAAQRHAAAHLAICPPLERAPACDAEQADGPPAAVKITQAMSYGVRLEIKLDQPATEPSSVIVEFSIREDGPAADA
jgi:hypothetical protein